MSGFRLGYTWAQHLPAIDLKEQLFATCAQVVLGAAVSAACKMGKTS